MKILSVDPGNEQSAWCVLVDGKPFETGYEENAAVRAKLREWKSEGWLLAVEMIASYGMPVGREVFDTCVWIGRFVEAWRGEHRLVYRKDVKFALCADSRAKDSNIRASLIDRFGPGKAKAIGTKAQPGPLYGISGDVWAALAVGVTAEPQSALNALEQAAAVPEPRMRITDEVPF